MLKSNTNSTIFDAWVLSIGGNSNSALFDLAIISCGFLVVLVFVLVYYFTLPYNCASGPDQDQATPGALGYRNLPIDNVLRDIKALPPEY